ncbi:MAG: TfoX/Sxy family protein [Moraxella sp.]|uniref:TfoX/Sxy family protein n=1 Tax=Moraxella sp. TaxID=479 RepID=UPI0026DD0011|nr:TfoX/Sxy family protein [Moraxella sp.]MDO4449399.1 TfoX/Sxy family protein [Moraxella sp.]
MIKTSYLANTLMINYLCEQLAPLGDISYKRMFGGYGVFLNHTMIGIVQDDEIFIKKLKIDDNDNRFGYLRQGKMVYLNYVLIDRLLLDEQDELIALVKSFLHN